MEDKRIITNEEYYNLLKEDLIQLKKEEAIDNNNMKILGNYCYSKKEKKGTKVYANFKKISALLEKQNGVKSFSKVLEVLFGPGFFGELDEEVKKKFEENNMFTKDRLDDLLGKIYGRIYGYKLKRPNNYEEFADFISICYKLYNNPNVNEKQDYFNIISAINRVIENRFNDLVSNNYKERFIIDIYSRFVSSYENGTKVIIKEEEKEKILKILNIVESRFFTQEDDEEKMIGTGDAFLIVTEAYNEDLELLNKKEKEEKESNKTNRKVDKYYNKITKTPIEKLEVKNFPKYSNENYLQIINALIRKLENDKLWDYVTLSYLNYMDYFKSDYFKDNESLQKKVSK